MTQRTDISGPSAPIVVNLTCNNLDALYLRWKRPLEYYNSIDFYIVSFRAASQHEFQEIKINASARHLETAVSVTTPQYKYIIVLGTWNADASNQQRKKQFKRYFTFLLILASTISYIFFLQYDYRQVALPCILLDFIFSLVSVFFVKRLN